MPRRPENPDRRITPRDVADGLRRSGKDPAEIRKWFQKIREAVGESASTSTSASASDLPHDRPPGVSPAEWEEYLAWEDDERRKREYGDSPESLS